MYLHVFQTLKNMFPDINDVVLQDVAENAMNSNEAVNVILEKQNQMQEEAAPYCKKGMRKAVSVFYCL